MMRSAVYLLVGALSAVLASGCGSTGRHASRTAEDTRQSTSPQVLDGFYTAQLAKLKNDPEAAYVALSKALDTSPDAAGLLFELGRLDHEQGRVEAAWDRFEAAIKQEPENRWFRKALGELALEIGQYKTAIVHFQWIVDHVPEDETAYEPLIIAYTAVGQVDGVFETIDQVEAVFGPDPYWSHLRWEMREKFGLELDMQAVYEAIYAENPDDLEALFDLLSYFESTGQISELETALDLAMERCSTCGALHMLKAIRETNNGHLIEAHAMLIYGLSHLESEDPIDAVHVCELWINTARPLPALKGKLSMLIDALIDAQPGTSAPYFLKGQNLVLDAQYGEAADALLTCFSLAQDQPEPLKIAVELLIEADRLNEAISAAEEGVAFFPMLPEFQLGLARSHRELGHFEEALAACAAGWPLVIDDESLHLQFGEVKASSHLALDQLDQAWNAYETLIVRVPNSPWVHNNFSYELAVRGLRLERALELVIVAAKIIQEDAAIEDTYAWVLYQQGKFEAALGWVEKALIHDEEKNGRAGGTLLDHAGDIAWALGQVDKALDFWLQALESGAEVESVTKKIDAARE